MGSQKFEFPEYKNNESNLVGLRVTTSAPIPFIKFPAHTAYFIKMDDDGEPDLSILHSSTVSKGKNIYLFDFDPGRYALVATVGKGGNGMTLINVLGIDSIEETTFDVTPNSFSYLGHYSFVVIDNVSETSDKGEFLQAVKMLLKEEKIFHKYPHTLTSSNQMGNSGFRFGISGATYNASLKSHDKNDEV